MSLVNKREAASVTLDDQQRINEFSVLNSRRLQLKEKLDQLGQLIENYQGAQTDFDLHLLENLDDSEDKETSGSGDKSLYKIGGVFMHLDEEVVTERLAVETRQLETEREQIQDELVNVERRAEALKRSLYGKFGDNIRLDPSEPIGAT